MPRCHHKEHNHKIKDGRRKLLVEALTVGVSLVPLYWIISKITTNITTAPPESKALLDAALTGFAFHLTAEASGLNAWYLTHGYAAEKQISRLADKQNDIHSNLDGLWDTRRRHRR